MCTLAGPETAEESAVNSPNLKILQPFKNCPSFQVYLITVHLPTVTCTSPFLVRYSTRGGEVSPEPSTSTRLTAPETAVEAMNQL